MKKPVAIILVVVVLLAAGVGGWLWYQSHQDKGLTLYGNVDIRTVNMSFRVGGRLASLSVDEGDAIKRGQTLGMQVWGVRVQNADGSAISLWQALLRFVVAIASLLCVGLGFFWSLFDKQKRSWHDMYSNTQLVRIPKQKK